MLFFKYELVRSLACNIAICAAQDHECLNKQWTWQKDSFPKLHVKIDRLILGISIASSLWLKDRLQFQLPSVLEKVTFSVVHVSW